MSNVYRDSGVDIEAGDSFSSFAGKICQASYQNSPFVEIVDWSRSHFRGPKGFRLKNLPDGYLMDVAPDGIGTKTIVIDAAGNYKQAAHNLFAMTAGDITRYGGKPLIFCNVLDVATLGQPDTAVNRAYRTMMEGLGELCRHQEVVCYRGETAELGVCVGSENQDATTKFNWAGMMLGVFLQDRVITGETLKPGQVVVALREWGCRSNGISAVRRAFRTQFGDSWWNNPTAKQLVEQAAWPSTIYDKFLAEVNGWTYPIRKPDVKMHAIAHISGGGIVDKFGHDILFRYGLSAELTNLFLPPDVLRYVVGVTKMSDREAYQTFSSGNGALVVVDAEKADYFVSMAKVEFLEAQVCGVITDDAAPNLRITSKYTGDTLVYEKE